METQKEMGLYFSQYEKLISEEDKKELKKVLIDKICKNLNVTVRDKTITVNPKNFIPMQKAEFLYDFLCELFYENYDCEKWLIKKYIVRHIIDIINNKTTIQLELSDNMTFLGLPIEVID